MLTWNKSSAASTTSALFQRNSSTVGAISYTSSAVTYATSSDYRLKENVTPMIGALAKIVQLKPVTYTWKTDGSAGQGFIAHELAEVCPQAVNGEKDALKEDGSIDDKPSFAIVMDGRKITDKVFGQISLHMLNEGLDDIDYQVVKKSDLKKLLNTIIKDAQMALDDEWDRSDDGFIDQQGMIYDYLSKNNIK